MAPQDDQPDPTDRPAEAFLDVGNAESTADVHVLTQRLRRAILQADLLRMPDVTRLLEQAILAAESHRKMDATIAGEPTVVKSIGQHEPEPS